MLKVGFPIWSGLTELRSLSDEFYECLQANSVSVDDIIWVGSHRGNVYIDVTDFLDSIHISYCPLIAEGTVYSWTGTAWAAYARFESQHVVKDLVIVGQTGSTYWWIQRDIVVYSTSSGNVYTTRFTYHLKTDSASATHIDYNMYPGDAYAGGATLVSDFVSEYHMKLIGGVWFAAADVTLTPDESGVLDTLSAYPLAFDLTPLGSEIAVTTKNYKMCRKFNYTYDGEIPIYRSTGIGG
jgi:hypothetical protein